RLAPEFGGDCAARGGGDEDDVAAAGGVRGDALPEVQAALRVGRGGPGRDEREAAQALVEVFAPDAVARLFLADGEADFRLLLYEVCDERGRLHDGALEARDRLRAFSRCARAFSCRVRARNARANACFNERVERDMD